MSKILIVDDQPHLQEFISQELMKEGCTVDTAKDAQSVKGFFGKTGPDLVLLELSLNGFEGWNVLCDIKSNYPHLPVLIVTAYDNFAEDPRLSMAQGYFVKDFDSIERLKGRIVDLLSGTPRDIELGPNNAAEMERGRRDVKGWKGQNELQRDKEDGEGFGHKHLSAEKAGCHSLYPTGREQHSVLRHTESGTLQ